MRILIGGEWRFDFYEAAIHDALHTLGHEVHRYSWWSHFAPRAGDGGPVGRLSTLLRKVQYRTLAGPAVGAANRGLEAAAREIRPDLLFLLRPGVIRAATIRRIQSTGPTAVVAYNNDDPFSAAYPAYVWRHFLAAVPAYDAVFAYREHNLADYRRFGAKKTFLLRSWYLPEQDHPVELNAEEQERFACDVVFVGHPERDGRLGLLEAIVRRGFRLRLFGNGWDAAIPPDSPLAALKPVRQVLGSQYAQALCGAKVALCFLSKLNRDTYTRRCFEIPATGTLLLSEYTDDLAAMFAEGREADYFRDQNELLGKLDRYVNDAKLRREVAAAGRRRVIADGHDVVSRMRVALAQLDPSPAPHTPPI